MSTNGAVDDQLAWERSRRVPAAVAAALGGILVLAPSIYAGAATGDDRPVIGELQALTPALQGRIEPEANPRTAIAQFLVDQSAVLITTGVLAAIGSLAVGVVLLYLFRATRSRLPTLPNYVRGMIAFGAALSAVAAVALPIAQRIGAQDYLDGADRTREAIETAMSGTPVLVFAGIGFLGTVALGFSTILVALNAMRAGLLTRFMGVLGIIVGALYILAYFIGQIPFVQTFWLLALAPLLLGRWPSGVPPAWASGKAEPWPTAAELREQRMRETGGSTPSDAGRGDDGAADPRPAPAASSSRKRRKRR